MEVTVNTGVGQAGETIFSLEQVDYSYPGEICALQGIDLEVQPQQHTGILGANGSGKSTLLKIMDGLYFPVTGQVVAFGRPLTAQALEDDSFAFDFRRRVGLIFQDPDVQLFSATVWDEVAFAPLQLGWPAAEVRERVEDKLEWLGLAHLRDRPPYRLSGGEKRKVALAAVLVVEPEVLLLDEPTTFLDPRTRCQLFDYLFEWGQRGGTLVAATHDLEFTQEITQQVYVLDRGRILASGRPEDILADEDLLQRTNLIHVHKHYHGEAVHSHRHEHGEHGHD
jgi:cobalt/nickel transport system ATP-binding protein